jgi:hypothetical protein
VYPGWEDRAADRVPQDPSARAAADRPRRPRAEDLRARPEEAADDPERIAIREALAFGKALYDIRTELGLTVAELATRAGMTDDDIERNGNERHNLVTGLPAPLRVLCRLTSGNRQPCRLAAPELTTNAVLFCVSKEPGRPGKRCTCQGAGESAMLGVVETAHSRRASDCTEAALPALVTAALNSYVSKLWEGLGCHGMARADFIAAGDGTVCALEVNTTPGMSYESNFTAAGLLGFGHAGVVIAILREVLTRPRYEAPLPVPDFINRPVPHS